MNAFGVKIKVNPFTWVFILLLVFTGYLVEFINIVLTLFIHELSHAYAAKKLKVEILEVDIFPFGGAFILDSSAFLRPDIEILIALAGPLANLVFVLLLNMFGEITGFYQEYLIKINIIMCLFNLLPGLPLDGGRTLKSILSTYIGVTKAYKFTSYISYVISFLMLYIGIYSILNGSNNYELFILSVFLFIAAKSEKKLSIYFHLRDVAYKKADFYKRGHMDVKLIAVLENQKINKIINCFLPLKYHIIVVLDKNLMEKYRLTETELFDYIISNGLDNYIGDIK